MSNEKVYTVNIRRSGAGSHIEAVYSDKQGAITAALIRKMGEDESVEEATIVTHCSMQSVINDLVKDRLGVLNDVLLRLEAAQ